MTNDFKLRQHEALVVVYLILALIFFIMVALPVMNGTMDFQFYSDSKTYQLEAEGSLERNAFFDIGNNTIGPVQILLLLGPRNYFLIFLFNIFLFFISIRYLSASSKFIDKKRLCILMLLSPVTFTSLMSINKEMIAFLCVALIIYNHTRKKIGIELLLIPLTYLVRWQFTGFYIFYLLLFSKINFLKKYRFVVLVILLLGITGILFVTRDTLLEMIFSRYDNTVDSWDEGRGTFAMVQSIQDNYGYIFAFIPKVLLLLGSMVSRYAVIFDFSDAYNNFILFFQTIWNILILYLTYKKKCMNFQNDYFYIALVYCAIYAITPIFNTRYFYPAMLFLCYAIASAPKPQTIRTDNIKARA